MTRNLHPRTAIITNITPDHLDRHKTFENYIRAKAKVFLNMQGKDHVIINYDDPVVRSLEPEIPCEIDRFTLTDDTSCSAYLQGNMIVLSENGKVERLIDKTELNLLGNHNVANVMAASLAAYLNGVPLDSIRRTLHEFRPVANRLEFVAEKNGIRYINDSKGTNPEASMTALQAIDAPIILIMGGYDKKAAFDDIFTQIQQKVKHVVVLGQTKKKILEAAERCGYRNITAVNDYPEAVAYCTKVAASGDCVLLSPACASWDMFEDYEQRGELFRQLVNEI
jgi:UDP-N-acetylmuramoylalanine--D-glutamate ligase